jgi:rhodanese-related sulfurtransferase
VNVPLAELDPMRGMMPNPDFAAVMAKLFKPGEQLVLGCAAGGRSRQACMILAAQGFTNLLNLAGGFSGPRGWSQSGLPVAKDGTTYAEARKKAGV